MTVSFGKYQLCFVKLEPLISECIVNNFYLIKNLYAVQGFLSRQDTFVVGQLVLGNFFVFGLY